MSTTSEGPGSPSPPLWVPPGPSRSPFQRFAGSLRRSRSSSVLKSMSPLSDAPKATPSSAAKVVPSSNVSSHTRNHTSPTASPSKGNYAPGHPSPLMSSALLSFGSVSEAEGDSHGTGYPWDPRPVTPKEMSFSIPYRNPSNPVDVATAGRSKKSKDGLARVVSGSISEFGAKPYTEGRLGQRDEVQEEGSLSRNTGGHGRSRSLFALSKKGRSLPAPPTPVSSRANLPTEGSINAFGKSSDLSPSDRMEERIGASLKPGTLSKARLSTVSRGSLSRPNSLRSPPSPALAGSRPTSPESLRLPNSFLNPPSPSPLSSPTSSAAGTYVSRISSFGSPLPTSAGTSPAPSRSNSSMSGAFNSLRKKSSAVFGLGNSDNGSTPELPAPSTQAINKRSVTSPRSSAEPRCSSSSRPSSSSPRRSITIEDRRLMTGSVVASPLASPSSLSLGLDLGADHKRSISKLKKSSKSIGSMGAFKSMRRAPGRIGSVDTVGSTPDLALYSTSRKSEGGSPSKSRNFDSCVPLPTISPRTSSQLNERPRLSSPSRSSLLLQSTPKPSPFKSLRKKTSQVFRSSPDLSLRRQNTMKHEVSTEQSPRKKSNTVHQNHRASRSNASLGLMGNGFKLKFSSGERDNEDDDAKDDQEFGAGFKGFGGKRGVPVDSYRSGKVGFSSKEMDTNMSTKDERVLSRAEGIDHKKRKSLGSVLVGFFRPLTPRRSASQSVNRSGPVFPEYSGISIQVSTDRVVTSQ